MSVGSISAPAAPGAAPPVAAAPARTADGDYKSANVQTSQTKDSDGDYNPLSSSPAAQSATGVQASLTSLKLGG
jgi:hypothetical protein